MVLACLIGELGLKKEIGAGDQTYGICSSKTLANSGFKVMAALVGGIDSAKT